MCVYVRRMAGEELKESCIQTTITPGGGGIMVWGCINPGGVGCLSKIDRKLDGSRCNMRVLAHLLFHTIFL